MKKLFLLVWLPGLLLADADVLTKEVSLLGPSDTTSQILTSPDHFDSTSIEFYPLPRKSAFWAATLSGLLPGLGHAYLGDYKTAGMFLGSFGAFGGLGVSNVGNETFQISNLVTMQNLGFYSIYASYRDARAYNRFEGYNYSMPTDSGMELVCAPFQWSVIRKPEVWGGLLGALTIAYTVGVLTFSEDSKADCNVRLASSNGSLFPVVAFPVGIGEEAFFRGYAQSIFAESLSPWGGIALSSLFFGAMHIPNGLVLEGKDRQNYFTYSIPVITSFGVYFGWLTYKNHSLKESVALHSWYDFILFFMSYSAASSASIGKPAISFSLSF